MAASPDAELAALLPALPLPAASDQPGRPADFYCPDCGRCHAWAAATFATADGVLRCRDCATTGAPRRPTSAARWRAVLTAPLFYVGLLAVLAGVLFAAGWGNPRPAALAAADAAAQRPAYRQQLGRALLRQVGRVTLRLKLFPPDTPPAEVQRWARLAAGALHQLGDPAVWGNTPAAPHVRLAAAAMQARSGDLAGAQQALAALAPTFAAPHPARGVYLYQRGRVALALNDRAACRRDWEEVLQTCEHTRDLATQMRTYLDRMIETGGGGNPETIWLDRVRSVCETDAPGPLLVAMVLNELRDAGINSPVAAAVIKELGGVPTLPDALAPPAAAAPGPPPLFEKLDK